jgi:ribonucleotide reductase beta subunit family protein with ferritin-like domain
MLKGLTDANDYIAKDEAMHVSFACALYHELQQKLEVERVHAIVREAVEIEGRFADFLLAGPGGVTIVPQLPPAQMRVYVEVCADKLCEMLGVPRPYGAVNPLHYMDQISLRQKVNFFEKRNPEYETKPRAAVRFVDAELQL